MTIKAIVEVTLQPAKRDEFVRLLDGLMAQHRSTMQAAGWHGSTMYAVVDDPDTIIEIAEWESAKAREAVMRSEAIGGFAPVFELLAAPFSTTLVTELN
jgi:quinol monooxygenase YgiN